MSRILTLLAFILVSTYAVYGNAQSMEKPIQRPDTISVISAYVEKVDNLVRECPEGGDDTQCMVCAIYHEARGETIEGQIAVALVILNRVESPKYPNTVCAVVWQKGYSSTNNRYYGQFSFTTDDMPDDMTSTQAILDAESASIMANVIYGMNEGQSYLGIDRDVLWYHTIYVNPDWSEKMTLRQSIGVHEFYAL